MCIPRKKDLKLKLNEEGEGKAYKFFLGNKTLTALCSSYTYETNRWVESSHGPGFFMYRFKKGGMSEGWAHTHVRRIKFRNVKYQGISCGQQVIVAKEIFIPK